MKTGIIFLIIVLLLTGCKKEDVSDFQSTYICFEQTEWDSTKVKQTLEGLWNLEYMASEGAEKWTEVSDREISAEFKADGTVQVYEKGTLTQSSTWEIDVVGSEYSLKTTPYISLFRGRMAICEDILEFNGAISDGITNVFRKE